MKLLIFAIMALLLVPSLASAYVSLSVTGTTTPSAIEPGQKGNLILTISNIGTTSAQNVKLRIKPHAFITPDNTFYDLQSIPNGNSVQLAIPITVSQSVSEGTTALQFTIDYNDGSDLSGTRTQENSATILITKRTLLEITNVSYDKETIQPGDSTTMNLEIGNVGRGSIKDLFVSIYSADAPFVPTETSNKYLGSLAAGESKKVSFDLTVNNDAKTIAYTIPITLTYYDDFNTLHTDTKYIGLKLSGTPEFVVSIESTESMYAGNQGKISISISNRGTGVAQYLTTQFDSGLDVTPKENYVGNLNPDDSSTISLDVNLGGISAGKHSLNMTLKYKDPYNKDLTETRLLNFEVVNQPIVISSTTQIIIFVVIVGVLYWKRDFVLRLLRRKK